MAWIAAGRVDGFWELNLKPWDVAAGWLFVMEAEGKVSDFSGRRWKETTAMGVQTLATNGRIHKSMQEILRLSKSEKQA
jgi:myo-inositol-1(or 4)-monophosphatase